LAIALPFCSLCGVHLFGKEGPDDWALRWYCVPYILSTILLKEFVDRFLRERRLALQFNVFKTSFSLPFLMRLCGICAIGAAGALPVVRQFAVNGVWYIAFTSLGAAILSVQLIIGLYSLFILENTYRFAQEYQRKIGRLCFLSLFIILVFQLYFSSSILVYKIISEKLIYIEVVVYGVSFPVLLMGLLRYRLGSEHIAVPRNAVFSTVSLLLSSAVFVGIGLTIVIFKRFHFDFTYFEQTLIIFSFSLFAFLVIGSGSMRKRISRMLNHYFYSYKFDYREQFYNLHRSYTTGENLEGTLTEIIENMKYSVATDDAFIFIKNETDGHLYMHENKESATASACVIRGDSPIAQELSRTLSPVTLTENAGKKREATVLGEGALCNTIKADVLFPITAQRRLLGVLALKLRPKASIDSEDSLLIEVFANSIGDVLFKNRVLTQRVERKQFESFSHLSSFIIHDIKNQIATLSLLAGNADKNINNAEFQKSLLTTLSSCTHNLQRLVEKLKSPPHSDALKLKRLNINSIIDRVIENTGIAALGDVEFVFKKGAVPTSDLDEESLFYTVKNLVVNSLDAMNKRGKLTITTGQLNPLPADLLRLFDSGKDFFSGFSGYIMVSDTGCGMGREFMEHKLFHPFATTKDKGIGIGLYQCKTLIEKMGGKILCCSEIGRGTDFCILV
jgi:putative PEP-CTERM system histidine kinase